MLSNSNWLPLFESICARAPEALMLVTADQRIFYVNNAFEMATGYSADEALGRRPTLLSSGYHDEHFYEGMWQAINQAGGWQGLIWNRRKDGNIYPEWLTVMRVEHDGELVYAGLFSDLSAFQNMRHDLRRFACYDHLTELPNRALFEELMEARLRQCQRNGHSLVLLFVDIDHFKQFNDVYGHPFGDAIIRVVGERLRQAVRESDVVARFAGDEFVVLLDANDKVNDTANDDAGQAALDEVSARLTRAFAQPVDVGGESHYLSLTIGAARAPEDGEDVETLIRNADIALYAGKNEGRGSLYRFDQSLVGPLQRGHRIIKSLRQGLVSAEGEFHVVYQPLINLADDRCVGLEALLRWQSPELGPVSPGEFVPIAERHGLIQRLTERLVSLVTDDLHAQPAAPLAGLRLSLNMSALQVPNGILLPLVRPLVQLCQELDMGLELEITETQMVRHSEAFSGGLQQLQAAGISIAIDDFGTGYSVLDYLRRLAVDTLKIDRSFIHQLHCSGEDKAITRAVISMGQGLGLNVVAEGIEQEVQRCHLLALGCTVGQGFLWGKPQPLMHWLKGPRVGPDRRLSARPVPQ